MVTLTERLAARDAATTRFAHEAHDAIVGAPAELPKTREAIVAVWWDEIIDLSTALHDADTARSSLPGLVDALTYREAELALLATGGNAEIRKANLTMALQDDAIAKEHRGDVRYVEGQIRDADSRASVARNRIRLYQAILGQRDES